MLKGEGGGEGHKFWGSLNTGALSFSDMCHDHFLNSTVKFYTYERGGGKSFTW